MVWELLSIYQIFCEIYLSSNIDIQADNGKPKKNPIPSVLGQQSNKQSS